MSGQSAEEDKEATPILDRLAPLPPPPEPASRTAALGVAVLLCVALGVILKLWHPPLLGAFRHWVFAHFGEMLPRRWTGLLGMALSAVPIAFAVVAIHELGHAVVGRWAGFGFNSITVGPFKLDRGWRVSLYRGPGGWSRGWVGVLPAKRDHLRRRALAMVLAGPAANFLTGLAVLLLAGAEGFGPVAFIAASFVGGVGDLVPYRTRTMASDGWRIMTLLRKSAWGERWLALLRLGADLKDGVLPESLAADDLAKATSCQDASLDTLSGHAMAYAAAFHGHRDTEAGHFLETCLRHSSAAAPTLREALMSDAAVFQARRRKRPDLAGQWLAGIPEATPSPWLRLRAEAAILEAQGDLEGARRKLGFVEAAVRGLPDATQREITLRLLGRWQAELGRRPDSTKPTQESERVERLGRCGYSRGQPRVDSTPRT